MRQSSVIVTGASSGLGLAMARALVAEGHHVIAVVRNPAGLRAVLPEAGVSMIALDLAEQVDQERLTRELAARITDERPLVALVNNAGICTSAPMEALSQSDFETQLRVNLTSTLALVQVALPWLRAGHGTIINVGSGVAFMKPPFLGPYAVSKVALETLTTVLRREELGVRVTIVVPGAIKTPVWAKLRDSLETTLARMSAAQRLKYEARFRKLASQNDRASEQSRVSAPEFARLVTRIVGAKRVRARYLIGVDARAGFWIEQLFPTAWVDYLFRRLLRLPAAARISAPRV